MPHLFAAAVMSAVVLTLAALFGGEPPARPVLASAAATAAPGQCERAPHGTLHCAGCQQSVNMNRRHEAINHEDPTTGRRCPGSGLGPGDVVEGGGR